MKAELTKGDVYVVVDTPKKAKKLKNLLNMFGEDVYEGKVFHDDGYPYYTYISGFNHFVGCKYETGSNIVDKTKVSIKKLRNILAREHLKEGDTCVFYDSQGYHTDVFEDICQVVFHGQFNCKNGVYTHFKRYATPEEIALLEPQNGLCSLCKSKLGIK